MEGVLHLQQMPSDTRVIKPGKYQNIFKPTTVVDFVSEAEFRMGEMRSQCVVYTRKQRFYVRSTAEFLAKFRLIEG